MNRLFPRRLPWLLLISAVVIFLDRLTKTWVTLHIPMGGAIPVAPHVLRITHWLNEGAAFSLFADSASPHTVRWALIGFSLLAALVVLVVMVRLGDRFTLTTVALALVFAGALGNVHDLSLIHISTRPTNASPRLPATPCCSASSCCATGDCSRIRIFRKRPPFPRIRSITRPLSLIHI